MLTGSCFIFIVYTKTHSNQHALHPLEARFSKRQEVSLRKQTDLRDPEGPQVAYRVWDIHNVSLLTKLCPYPIML